jgi:hypothetical protein
MLSRIDNELRKYPVVTEQTDLDRKLSRIVSRHEHVSVYDLPASLVLTHVRRIQRLHDLYLALIRLNSESISHNTLRALLDCPNYGVVKEVNWFEESFDEHEMRSAKLLRKETGCLGFVDFRDVREAAQSLVS